MGQGHWDVLIYHSSSDQSEQLAKKLQDIILELQQDIGQTPKVASFVEHFAIGTVFDSMEDALSRCSLMLILITKDLLDDPMALFNSNQALTDSIMNKGGDKYVPIFEDRNTMRSLRTPTYIKMLQGVCISDLETSAMSRTAMVNTIKPKLIERMDRERRQAELNSITDTYVKEINNIKHEFEKKRLEITGAAEVELLQKQYAAKLQQLAKDQSIPDIQEILVKNGIDLPFLLSDHSSGFYSQTEHREPVEHDYTAIQDDDMGEEDTVEIRGQGSPTMEELKLPAALLPAEHRVEVVGRAAPLEVPPCTSEIDFRPVVVGEFDSIVTSGFSSVPRSLRTHDCENDSMIVECSEASIRDASSLLGSHSHANLEELDDESQFSQCGSADSAEVDMETGDNQVDLSILDTATGSRPLPMTSMTHHETDDESMVVEVDSTVGEDEVTFNQAPVQLQKTTSKESFKIPSSRVMHRSYAEYDDPDDVHLSDIDRSEGDPSTSPPPGLGGLASWPRTRRGSETFRDRRPFYSNLTTTRFLSLTCVQSLSSKLSRLHQHPSLNNISEWEERPRLLDGIRTRFGW